MPAGLLAMMLGSSLEAAAPAKALPSDEALFSRIWKPDPPGFPEKCECRCGNCYLDCQPSDPIVHGVPQRVASKWQNEAQDTNNY
jgi:hypothetical protein